MSTYGDYGSYGSYGTSGLDSMLGATIGLLAVVGIICIAAIVFAILMVIGKWKAYTKAGYKGWETLIVGHDAFVNCSLAGINPIWVLLVTISAVFCAIPLIGSLVYMAAFVYYQIIVGLSTAKAFGKGTGFGIALAIPVSAPIAWFMLGGKDVQYVGKNPCKDPFMEMFNKNGAPAQSAGQPMSNMPMNNMPVNNSMPMDNGMPINNNVVQPAVKFCTGCGYKVTNGERFCPGCGKEII